MFQREKGSKLGPTPASFPGAFGAVLSPVRHKVKIDPQAWAVELGELYADRIPESKDLPGVFADERALQFVKNIIIVVEIFDVNQALDEHIAKLHKKTDGTHIDDGRIKTLA